MYTSKWHKFGNDVKKVTASEDIANKKVFEKVCLTIILICLVVSQKPNEFLHGT